MLALDAAILIAIHTGALCSISFMFIAAFDYSIFDGPELSHPLRCWFALVRQ